MLQWGAFDSNKRLVERMSDALDKAIHVRDLHHLVLILLQKDSKNFGSLLYWLSVVSTLLQLVKTEIHIVGSNGNYLECYLIP